MSTDAFKNVAVIGAINIDINAKSFEKLHQKDSNPASIKMNIGGVGHNIACNLSQFACNVHFLTQIGQDEYAKEIEAELRSFGIDFSHSIKTKKPNSRYISIEEPSGEMAIAVCSPCLTDEITPYYIKSNLAFLNSQDAVVIEGNLAAETLEFIAKNCAPPIFADPVSITKSQKFKKILSHLHVFKPNLLEVEEITGMKIKNEGDLKIAAECLFQAGIKNVFISLGSKGVFFYDGKKAIQMPCKSCKLLNSSGAGDSFLAAIIKGHLSGYSCEKILDFALEVAAKTCEVDGVVNKSLGDFYGFEKLS